MTNKDIFDLTAEEIVFGNNAFAHMHDVFQFSEVKRVADILRKAFGLRPMEELTEDDGEVACFSTNNIEPAYYVYTAKYVIQCKSRDNFEGFVRLPNGPSAPKGVE